MWTAGLIGALAASAVWLVVLSVVWLRWNGQVQALLEKQTELSNEVWLRYRQLSRLKESDIGKVLNEKVQEGHWRIWDGGAEG